MTPDAAVTRDARPDRAAIACSACTEYGDAQVLGRLQFNELNELSGLAASREHPNVLYGHNDDDDRVVQVFALSDTGVGLGRFILEGAIRRDTDTEDIAVGPCPAGFCVFLSDAGDGGRNQTTPQRTEYAILRFAEPDVEVGAPAGLVSTPYERFAFVYPDGSHDSEALLVDPRSGAIYVVTKVRSGLSAVYKLPQPPRADAVNMVTKVADLPVRRIAASDDLQITAGSAHPCATAILIRTYSHVLELRAPDGAPFESVFTVEPRRVPNASLGGGAEALAYRPDGRGYLLAPEGIGARIAEVRCR